MTDDLTQFRDWMQERHGTDYGASDVQMLAVLEHAHAKRRALGYGNVYVTAGEMLRDAVIDAQDLP